MRLWTWEAQDEKRVFDASCLMSFHLQPTFRWCNCYICGINNLCSWGIKLVRSYMKQWWYDYCCTTWTCFMPLSGRGGKAVQTGSLKVYRETLTHTSPHWVESLSSLCLIHHLREQSLLSAFNTCLVNRFPLPINVTHYSSLGLPNFWFALLLWFYSNSLPSPALRRKV